MQSRLWGRNGRPARILINEFMDGNRIRKEELGRAIDDINGWREVVRSICLKMIRQIDRT